MDVGVPGVRIGHWSDPVGETGCTVMIVPEGTVASCEVRGGAPAARELAVLAPDKTVGVIDAIVLTGGSAFGLASADGVMRYLEENGRGVPTVGGRVPIVPTMAVFDLTTGNPATRPTAEHGYQAAKATEGEQIRSGRIGVGTGAYTGRWRGPDAHKPSGIAYAERRLDDLVVATVCVVNAFGDIDYGTDEVCLDAVAWLKNLPGLMEPRQNTTIGAVFTNARLDKISCRIMAEGAHDGLARALTPPHSRFDGDAIIAAATGEVEANIDVVRLMALAVVTEAIRSAGTGFAAS